MAKSKIECTDVVVKVKIRLNGDYKKNSVEHMVRRVLSDGLCVPTSKSLDEPSQVGEVSVMSIATVYEK